MYNLEKNKRGKNMRNKGRLIPIVIGILAMVVQILFYIETLQLLSEASVGFVEGKKEILIMASFNTFWVVAMGILNMWKPEDWSISYALSIMFMNNLHWLTTVLVVTSSFYGIRRTINNKQKGD